MKGYFVIREWRLTFRRSIIFLEVLIDDRNSNVLVLFNFGNKVWKNGAVIVLLSWLIVQGLAEQ